jgi:hypothetical protein
MAVAKGHSNALALFDFQQLGFGKRLAFPAQQGGAKK